MGASRKLEDWGGRHYDIVQWADFVRGVLPLAEQAEMLGHLHGGCAECQPMVDLLSRLTEVAREAVRFEAPEPVVRQAEEIFPVARPKRAARLFRLPVELVYDSFLVPAPAGVRTGQQPGWQAHYRAGVCSLDLRVEPEARSGKATLVGQLSDRREPEMAMANLPVRIQSGRRVVAETQSNPCGEFELEYESKGSLNLLVILPESAQSIRVPLRRFKAD